MRVARIDPDMTEYLRYRAVHMRGRQFRSADDLLIAAHASTRHSCAPLRRDSRTLVIGPHSRIDADIGGKIVTMAAGMCVGRSPRGNASALPRQPR